MKKLISRIEELKKGQVGKLVDNRVKEFRSMQAKDNKALFNELCFCLLTANYTSEGGSRIQAAMKDEFSILPREKLAARLKELRYRFPNVRAGFIHEAQQHKDNIKSIIKGDSEEVREWLVKNIKGLGYKEASHFLRNIGFDNLAIIDFHIVDVLVDNKLIEEPKTLTKNKYLKIEQVLRKLGEKTQTNMAELDLYLWYMETGKVLK